MFDSASNLLPSHGGNQANYLLPKVPHHYLVQQQRCCLNGRQSRNDLRVDNISFISGKGELNRRKQRCCAKTKLKGPFITLRANQDARIRIKA